MGLAAFALGFLTVAGPVGAMVPLLPPTNSVTLSWEAPYKGDTNLSYTIYTSPEASFLSTSWLRVTNVAWPECSVPISSTAPSGYFVVTVSNFWGETPLSGAQAAPGTRNVTLAWDYEETPDPGLWFTLYHSTDETVPMYSWPAVTNVPGTSRSLTISLAPGTHIFSLTASNALGESDFSNIAATPPVPTQPRNLQMRP